MDNKLALDALDEERFKRLVAALAGIIREVGEVPSGVLYAHLQGIMSVETFQRVIGVLKRAGLVEENSNVLKWVEPKKKGTAG